MSLLGGNAASALPGYGTSVDTTCTTNGWVPAMPFNPNGGNPYDPSQVNCGLCHTNASSPNGSLTVAGDQYRRSGHTDVTPFCSSPVANQTPVFAGLPAQNAVVGTPFELTVSATDPEGGMLLLSIANAPTGSTFTDAGNGTGTFLWTPTASQLGAHTLTFHAADTGTPMSVASMDVAIAVGQAANLPPVLAPIGNQQLDPDQTLAFTLSAHDPEGQTLAFSATGLPTGASLVGADFSWTPDANQTGQHSMTFEVSDSGSPAASDSETIVVTVGRLNRPPVLSAIGNRQVQVGGELHFVVTATDPDSDPIAIGCMDLPTEATFTDLGDGTAELSWSPTAAADFDVTCTATDSGTPSLSDEERFRLSAFDAASAAAPRLDDAVWSQRGGKLFVQGTLPAEAAMARQRTKRPTIDVFAVLSDGSTVLLGSRLGSRSGSFRLELEPFIAPCSVAVGSGGAMSSAVRVRNAPGDCETVPLTRARASLACDGTSLKTTGTRAPIGGQVVVSDGNDGALLGIIPVVSRNGRFDGTAAVSVAPTSVGLRAEAGGMSWSLEKLVPVMQSDPCSEDDESDDVREAETETRVPSVPLRKRRADD